MLKRSPGPKVRGMPSSTIGLPEGSFLVDFVTEYSYPSRKIEQKGGFVLWKEEGTLDGTLQGIPRLGLKPPGSSRHSGSNNH